MPGRLWLRSNTVDLSLERKTQLVKTHGITMVVCVTNQGDDSWNEVPGVRYRHYPMTDGREIPDYRTCVDDITLEMDLGGKTLVYCYSGLNRSALVACLVAMRITNVTGAELVQHLRTERGLGVFNNQYFRRHIEEPSTQTYLFRT